MQTILDFVRMRLRQLTVNLDVYRDLGPAYQDQVERITAILGELRAIESAIETFMTVEEYQISTHVAETQVFED